MATIPKGNHHLCTMFPDLPPEELDELAKSIKKIGLQEAIWTYEGRILDGKNRFRACALAGVKPFYEPFEGTEAEAIDFVLAKNFHRRHMSIEQKRVVIAEVLKSDPTQSDRKIAEQTQSSGHTVAEVREELEEKGEIEDTPVRTGSDGKQRPTARGAQLTSKTGAEELDDAQGNPVPERLRDVFGDPWILKALAKIDEWLIDLGNSKLSVGLKTKTAAYGAWMHSADAAKQLAETVTQLNNLRSSISAGVPHVVCSSCQGKNLKGGECADCRSTGWLPEWRFEELK